MKKYIQIVLLWCHTVMGLFMFTTTSAQPITAEIVEDLTQLGRPVPYALPDNFITVGNLIYFVASNGRDGRELWRSDGTSSGTFMLKDIHETILESSNPKELTKVGNFLYFKAFDGQRNRLCKTNGTREGTIILPNIYLFGDDYLSFLTAGPGNTCFFFGDYANFTYKLFQSDGTTGGTTAIKTFSIGFDNDQFQNDIEIPRIYPSSIMYNGTHVYFTAANGSYGRSSIRRMWKSDLTAAGTVFAGAECNFGEKNDFTPNYKFIRTVDNNLLFVVKNNSCVSDDLLLYKINPAGLMSFVKVLDNTYVKNMEYIAYNGRYYFVIMMIDSNVELWETDGTPIGTKLVKNLNNGLNDIGYHISNPTDFSFTLFNNLLYIIVNDSQEDYSRWWKSDGTTAGSNVLSGISLGSAKLTATNTDLYFLGRKKDYWEGTSIWKTDGTHENTAMIPVPNQDVWVGNLTKMNNELYFSTRNELWKTKTCNGTVTPGNLPTQNVTSLALPVEKQYIYDNGNCGNLIARVLLNNNAGRTGYGNLSAKLWVDGVDKQQNFVRRHYQLQLTSATSRTGLVTLYFTQQEFDDFNAVKTNVKKLPTSATDAAGKANLRISKFAGVSENASGWPNSYPSVEQIINPTDEDIEYIARNIGGVGHWKVSFLTTGFSGFFIHTSALVVLPLEMVSFTATAQNNNALLHWTTANEINVNHFELERSTDGITFILATKLAAGGNNYLKLLENEAQYGNKLYYRLKIIDKDGSVAHSNVANVQFNNYLSGISNIYPNPVKSKLTIVSNQANYQLVLTNSLGQQLGTYKISQAGSTQLDFSKIPKGIYILKANFANGKNQQFKLVKE